jgi:hypothetical protein
MLCCGMLATKLSGEGVDGAEAFALQAKDLGGVNGAVRGGSGTASGCWEGVEFEVCMRRMRRAVPGSVDEHECIKEDH